MEQREPLGREGRDGRDLGTLRDICNIFDMPNVVLT